MTVFPRAARLGRLLALGAVFSGAQLFGGTTYFKSNFEAGVTIGPKGYSSNTWAQDLFGWDVSSTYGWDTRLQNSYTSPEGAKIGDFYINVENVNKNQASLVSFGGSQVLKFFMTEATDTDDVEPRKHRARIQTEFAGNTGLQEFYYTLKMYLPSTSVGRINTLSGTWGGNYAWFTLAEFFSQLPGDKFSRIVFGLRWDDNDGKKLKFYTNAQESTDHKNMWSVLSNEPIPFDTWLTIEVYIKSGDNANQSDAGRVYISMTPAGGTRKVLCNVKGPTRSPFLTTSSDFNFGYDKFFPMKLYTNKPIIDHVRSLGTPLTVYWDNFSLYIGQWGTPPASFSTNIQSVNYTRP